ncbi:hypothetical protein CIB48_g3395 [Xylaria polymorpha]|nr:hypothetical protein CIB48_g3395 [Xylaria polymorpha]
MSCWSWVWMVIPSLRIIRRIVYRIELGFVGVGEHRNWRRGMLSRSTERDSEGFGGFTQPWPSKERIAFTYPALYSLPSLVTWAGGLMDSGPDGLVIGGMKIVDFAQKRRSP